MGGVNGAGNWVCTDDGSIFLETHHVVPLSERGSDTLLNVVALCANHHREAHLGSSRVSIRNRLLQFLRPRVPKRGTV